MALLKIRLNNDGRDQSRLSKEGVLCHKGPWRMEGAEAATFGHEANLGLVNAWMAKGPGSPIDALWDMQYV